MQTKRILFYGAMLLSAAMLWGCGSSGSGGSSVERPEGEVVEVGSSSCKQCHGLTSHNELNSIWAGGNDLVGVVPNALVIVHECEDCHGGGSAHHGTDGKSTIPYPVPTAERCAVCHDQVPGILAWNSHVFEDNAGEIAPACASCHEPLTLDEAARAEALNCMGCHNTDAVDSVVTAANSPISAKVTASKHADNSYPTTREGTARCQMCHTTEGFLAFAATGAGDADQNHLLDELTALPVYAADGITPIITDTACAACHDPHGGLREVAGWDPNGNGAADQFDLCTACHTYYSQDGTLIGSGTEASETAPFYHDDDWYRMITSTHYDDPATNVGAGGDKTIEGYVIRQNSENPCFDCHGHELRTNTRRHLDDSSAGDDYGPTIHTDWANSAHAGGLLKAKVVAAPDVDAVMAAGVIDAPIGNAWAHYDWDSADRQGCQHCHTATGAASFLDAATAGTDYVAANNDFSHLDPNQNELLYCWGCHSSVDTGALRATDAIKLDYLVGGSAASITAPDGNSAGCLSCHSGRGNMDTLLKGATPDPAGAAVTGGTSTHYLVAGGTIFQSITKTGYKFGALSYADPVYYGHDSLGCAECHMTAATVDDKASHSFEVVEKDATDVITAIASEKCVECHDGEHALFVAESQVDTTQNIWNGVDAAVPTVVTAQMAIDAAAEMEHEAHGYHDALSALAAVLTTAGTPPQAGYPYFSGTSTDQGHGGAMHNYSYLHHEPGAYAHNRYYAKRLIFDSIDWLSNPTDGGFDEAGSRSLNGVIYLDPATYSAAIAWLDGDSDTPGIQRP